MSSPSYNHHTCRNYSGTSKCSSTIPKWGPYLYYVYYSSILLLLPKIDHSHISKWFTRRKQSLLMYYNIPPKDFDRNERPSFLISCLKFIQTKIHKNILPLFHRNIPIKPFFFRKQNWFIKDFNGIEGVVKSRGQLLSAYINTYRVWNDLKPPPQPQLKKSTHTTPKYDQCRTLLPNFSGLS